MRKLLAIWAVKILSIVGKLIGRKSSNAPGVVALKICPDIIRKCSKDIKKGTIVVSGTNGKTTTNNMIYAELKSLGFQVICNKLGANMIGGIATTLCQEANILGRIHADYACFEIDEASTVKIFDQLTPQVMVITNLFRDQLDRYGEIDITMQKLKTALKKAPKIKLVLNGDDPLTASFGTLENVEATYYGISEKVLPQINEVKEGQFCQQCGKPLKFEYYHYSQLGNYHCPSCGAKRPKIDYEVKNVDLRKGMNFTINEKPIHIDYKGFYNIYNVVASYGACCAMGIDTENFAESFKGYKPQIGRMEQFEFNKPVILNLSKNPAGFNQSIQTVLQDRRKKDIIITINDNYNDGTDVSWLWDVDFAKLNDGTMNTLTCTGLRLYDIALRFKYEDIHVDEISADVKDAVRKSLNTDSDVVYLLVTYSALYATQKLLKELKKEWEENLCKR